MSSAGIPIPAALGRLDTSEEGRDLVVRAATQITGVLRARGLTPVERLSALMVVAGAIVASVPPSQDAAAARVAHAILDLQIATAARTMAGVENGA